MNLESLTNPWVAYSVFWPKCFVLYQIFQCFLRKRLRQSREGKKMLMSWFWSFYGLGRWYSKCCKAFIRQRACVWCRMRIISGWVRRERLDESINDISVFVYARAYYQFSVKKRKSVTLTNKTHIISLLKGDALGDRWVTEWRFYPHFYATIHSITQKVITFPSSYSKHYSHHPFLALRSLSSPFPPFPRPSLHFLPICSLSPLPIFHLASSIFHHLPFPLPSPPLPFSITSSSLFHLTSSIFHHLSFPLPSFPPRSYRLSHKWEIFVPLVGKSCPTSGTNISHQWKNHGTQQLLGWKVKGFARMI